MGKIRKIRTFREGVAFWLTWTLGVGGAYGLAHVLTRLFYQGVLFGAGTGVPAGSFMFRSYISAEYRSLAAVLGLAALSILIRYGALGAVQWWFLSRIQDLPCTWMPLTALGGLVSGLPEAALHRWILVGNRVDWIQAELLGVPVLFVGGALLSTLVFSLFQWLLLRRKWPRAGWWIGAAVLGSLFYLLVINPHLPYYAWREDILLSPLSRLLGVPAAGWLAASLGSVIYQFWLQAVLGLALTVGLWEPRERVLGESLPV